MIFKKISPYITLTFQVSLGFVLVYASAGKLSDPGTFAKEIYNYQIFPLFIAKSIAIFLPWLELILGLFLIFGLRLKSSAIFSTFLLVLATLAVASAFARGLNINCGCFAHHVEYVGWEKIFENTLLIAMGIFIYFFPNSSFTFEKFINSK